MFDVKKKSHSPVVLAGNELVLRPSVGAAHCVGGIVVISGTVLYEENMFQGEENRRGLALENLVDARDAVAI